MKEPFECVYNRYYKRIYYYIYRKINNHFESEDLTQVALIKCFKSYHTYDPDRAEISTWIYTVVNNTLKNYYRDKKEIFPLDNKENGIILKDEMLIEEAYILEEQKKCLYNAIRMLGERERLIVKEKYFGKKNSVEIAKILNTSPSNVRVILKRTIDKLHKYFVKNGYDIERK